MTRRVVVGDLRVQRLDRRNGLRSWTIVWPEGTVHEEADRFLRLHDGSGTQKTYAYYLVDHLRWLERECLSFGDVRLRDLERYMGVVGADVTDAAGRAVAGRQAPLRPGGAVDGGGLPEGLLPAPVVPRRQHGAGRGARPDEAADPGGPAAGTAGAREDGDACEPAGPEGPVPPAPEDAPGRRTGVDDRHRELGEGPADRVLAGRRGPADRRAVRPAPCRPASPAGRGLRGVPAPAPARVPPAREPERGRGQDQAPVADRAAARLPAGWSSGSAPRWCTPTSST